VYFALPLVAGSVSLLTGVFGLSAVLAASTSVFAIVLVVTSRLVFSRDVVDERIAFRLRQLELERNALESSRAALRSASHHPVRSGQRS
jgi:hypothetical protein